MHTCDQFTHNNGHCGPFLRLYGEQSCMPNLNNTHHSHLHKNKVIMRGCILSHLSRCVQGVHPWAEETTDQQQPHELRQIWSLIMSKRTSNLAIVRFLCARWVHPKVQNSFRPLLQATLNQYGTVSSLSVLSAIGFSPQTAGGQEAEAWCDRGDGPFSIFCYNEGGNSSSLLSIGAQCAVRKILTVN